MSRALNSRMQRVLEINLENEMTAATGATGIAGGLQTPDLPDQEGRLRRLFCFFRPCLDATLPVGAAVNQTKRQRDLGTLNLGIGLCLW